MLKSALFCVGALLGLNMSTASGVMTTPGGFESNSGTGSYTIPIQIPPGTAGVAPKLSLAYSSTGADGMVGVGWGIGGLSAIVRCPTTLAQGGTLGTVNYDAADHFCLDGQHLYAVSGAYGANGTEYRTEIESFKRIISYGTAGVGPAWFKVWTKQGEIMEYGNTVDSRIEATGKSTARVWALNKVSDTKTNYFTVTYSEDTTNGDFVPDRVDYTGHAGLAKAPYNSVRFVYGTRPSAVPQYRAGSVVKQTKNLSYVRTYSDSTQVREYRLAYETSAASRRQRLISVTECANSTCLPAVTLGWSGTSLDTPSFTLSTGTGICANGSSALGVCNDSDNHESIRYADINGDGRADICFRSDSGITCLAASSAGTWNTASPWYTSICANNSTAYGVCNDEDNYKTIVYGDINGDGRADLLYRGDQGIQLWFSNGVTFTGQVSYNICANGSTAYGKCDSDDNYYSIRLADVTGDGRADVCFRAEAGIRCYPSTGNGLDLSNPLVTTLCSHPNLGTPSPGVCNDADNFDTIAFVDVTGDGRADLLYRSDQSGMYAFSSTGTAFVNPISSNFCIATSGSGGCRSVKYADVNGDGIVDMCNRGGLGVNCVLSTGISFVFSGLTSYICGDNSTTYGGCNDSDNYSTIAYNPDVNGDGTSDLVYRGDQGIQVWYITGNSFTDWKSYTICANNSSANGGCNDDDNYESIEVIDVNGDALGDLVYRGDIGMQVWFSQYAAPDLMTSISSGIGYTTTVTYLPLTDSRVYERGAEGTASNYPLVFLQTSSYVVYEEKASNGVGGLLTTQYKYGDLRAELTRHGPLGFRWENAYQVESKVGVRTEYEQVWPFVGIAKTIEKSIVNADNSKRVLHLTSNTLACQNPVDGSPCPSGAQTNVRYFPYVETSVVGAVDLNGTSLPGTTTTTQFDVHGNATQVDIATTDGFSKSTVNTYFNDGTNWILGRLTSSKVTSTAP